MIQNDTMKTQCYTRFRFLHVRFLPSADYKVVAEGLGITFFPTLPPDFIEIGCQQASYNTFDDNYIFDNFKTLFDNFLTIF
jgi:hypothetical protein